MWKGKYNKGRVGTEMYNKERVIVRVRVSVRAMVKVRARVLYGTYANARR